MSTSKPCRYCGNEVAPNAKRCPNCDGKNPFPVSPVANFFGLIIVVLIVGSCCWPGWLISGSSNSSGATKRSKSTQSRIVSVGQEGILSSGGDAVLLGVSKESYSRLVSLSVANDTVGIMDMILTGKVFSVKGGTRCRVIQISSVLTNTREVRILEGDNYGLSGFTAGEFVKQIP